MRIKAFLFSLLPLSLAAASGTRDFRDAEALDTLDIYLATSVVGNLVQRVTYNEKDKTIADVTVMRINAEMSHGGGGNLIELRETRIFNDAGYLKYAYQELIGQSGTNSWELRKEFNIWYLIATIGGQRTRKKIGAPSENILADCEMRHEIKTGSMRVGGMWRDTVFEMMSGVPITITTRCVKIDTAQRRWTFEMIDNVSRRTEKWVLGNHGETIERSIEGIYVAKQREKSKPAVTTSSTAITMNNAAGSITELFAIPAEGACPRGKSIAVVLPDTSLSLDSSVGFLYKQRNTAWVLRDIPRNCGQQTVPSLDSVKQWLMPGATIQSNHPKIVELAKKLRGKETDPCALIAKFNHYVFSHLEKRNTATFSNALETLNAGYGDCGEHAALLTALLRAAGVPARVALGLLYVESKNQYLYHAQVMAFSGEWIFADPTWDIFPASGRFVPLIIDDSTGAKAMLLARLLGKIKIDYVYSF